MRPDFVRLIDVPSRGSECSSTVGFGARLGRWGAVLNCRAKLLRLGAGFGVARLEDRIPRRLRQRHRNIREPRPTKIWLRPGSAPWITPKKIQPPVSAGYEGLLFPPEQSEKISRHNPSGSRAFQMICLYIVPMGLAAFRENASFSPHHRNLLTEWTFTRSMSWRFEYISSLGLLSGLSSLTGNH
jgi:hypothetical protein